MDWSNIIHFQKIYRPLYRVTFRVGSSWRDVYLFWAIFFYRLWFYKGRPLCRPNGLDLFILKQNILNINDFKNMLFLIELVGSIGYVWEWSDSITVCIGWVFLLELGPMKGNLPRGEECFVNCSWPEV